MADESQNSEDQRCGVKGGRTEMRRLEVGGDVGGRKWKLGD